MRLLFLIALLLSSPAMAQVKLSSLPSAGTYNAATDKLITVRSGTTDVQTILPTSLPPSGVAAGDLGGTYPNPTVLSLAHTVPTGAGVNGGNMCSGYPNVTICAQAIGYADPRNFGAYCDGGTHDDAPYLQAAAVNSGYPVMVGGNTTTGSVINCTLKTQLKATQANESFFAFPGNNVYDSSIQTNYRATLRVNNSNGAFTNACAIDFAALPFTLENINIQGDYVGTGTTAICTSVAYAGYPNPLPWLTLRHITISNFDDGVGYAMNTTTGLPTGSLGDNLIEAIYEDVTFEENGWASYQNYSDMKYTDGRVTGNDCGGFYMSGGGQGNHFAQIRFEDNAAHSFCGTIAGTIGAALTVAGFDTTCIACNFEQNGGAAIQLIGAWGYFSGTGYMKGNATARRANYDADVVFTGNSSSVGGAILSFTHYAVVPGSGNITPNYAYEWTGTAGTGSGGTNYDTGISILGDNGDSTGWHTAFYNKNGYTVTPQAILTNDIPDSALALGSLKASGIIAGGTKFTTSGCSISATSGGSFSGKFTLGASTCTVVVTMNGATGFTAATGWECPAWDKTAPTILIGGNSSSSTTTASFTIPAGAGATDVIGFGPCIAY